MKNERLKSKNKRRALAHCLLSIKVLGLVYVRKKKKKKKIVVISIDLLCLMTRYKIFFGLKGLQIKMDLELFHKVPAGAIEMLFDEQNQPSF